MFDTYLVIHRTSPCNILWSRIYTYCSPSATHSQLIHMISQLTHPLHEHLPEIILIPSKFHRLHQSLLRVRVKIQNNRL